MKLPINIAKEYTEINLNTQEVIRELASKIGEVEGTTELANAYNGVYVAEIVKKELHPDSEKLGIYQISIGKEQHQVVAGDRTLEVGDKVAYILPGNIVPSTYKTSQEFKISSRKLGGVLSDGMLCSEKELNIGPNHNNVLKLDKDAPLGELFSKYYQLDDQIVEIENKALTNRGDLFGIIGLARELSVIQGIKFNSPKWYTQSDIKEKITSKNPVTLNIDNQVENLCPRYMGIVMDSITVESSPVWLKSALIRSGIKPINNIVDITNYLMILTGQPLHAFDFDKVVKNDPKKDKDSAHITIRLAKDGENLHTLDNKVTELNSNTIVIADSTNPIAIGGMIGGVDTEIDENTKRIIIECANFDRFNIRKSSMALGIRTDAVVRYTRSQDPNQCLAVLIKSIKLIQENAGGEIASNVEDVYFEKYTSNEITLSVSKVNAHLGISLEREGIVKILENLEYTILPKIEDEYITVLAPTFRRDISIVEDIHEDIGRIFGYDNIPTTIPTKKITAPKINRNIEIKSKIRNILKNSGSNEILTYNFVGSELIKRANQDPNISYKISNAQSPELELMRPSLLVSMLEKTQQNSSRGIEEFSLFEFNIPHQKGYLDKFNLPKENWHLSFVYTNKENKFSGSSYYQVKRYFEKVIDTLGIEGLEYEILSDTIDEGLPIWIKNIINSFERNSSALIYKKDGKEKEVVGIIGETNNIVKENFKLFNYTGMFEINLDILKKSKQNIKKYHENSKYPSIVEDITFTVKDNVNYKTIEEVTRRTLENRNTKVDISCVDIYKENEKVEDKKITIRVVVENMEKTISDKELQKSIKRVEKTLENSY